MAISDKHLKSVCKPGQEGCCSYLGHGGGWSCLKDTGFQAIIDERRAKGTIRAMGDNCRGWDEEKGQEKELLEANPKQIVKPTDGKHVH